MAPRRGHIIHDGLGSCLRCDVLGVSKVWPKMFSVLLYKLLNIGQR